MEFKHFLAALSVCVLASIVSVQAETKNATVEYFDKDQVAAAFKSGIPLIEHANYKVIASQRESPGMVEVHTKDTDIFYIVEGTATFVTGGTIVDGRTFQQNEIRGKSIDGGEIRKLTKGDVIIVPHGVPHWFKEVTSPFNYFVVKVAK